MTFWCLMGQQPATDRWRPEIRRPVELNHQRLTVHSQPAMSSRHVILYRAYGDSKSLSDFRMRERIEVVVFKDHLRPIGKPIQNPGESAKKVSLGHNAIGVCAGIDHQVFITAASGLALAAQIAE